jgi:2-keto-4-pentenoate hydratase/2-oxohepta-3-ene-1,7-dioic acid hydratase in catechol pathway
MRLARVLLPESIRPVVALERDGALYELEALERAWGLTELGSDLHRRLIALRGAGLAALDERLGGGDRPSAARIARAGFLWLAPCDAARAACVHIDVSATRPRFWLGSARGLLGHGATVDVAPDTSVELALGVLIGEELRRASAREVEAAIVGYAPALRYGASSPPADLESALRDRTQLGPVLVSRDAARSVELARSRLRVGATTKDGARLGDACCSVPEAIAEVSRDFDFTPGDLVIFGPFARLAAVAGQAVVGSVEQLGALSATTRARDGSAPYPAERG